MRRSYKAARRAARRAALEPVEFDVEYETEEQVLGSDETHWAPHIEHFVARGEISTLMLSELAYNSDLETADPEAMALIRRLFSEAFGDDAEYRRFFKVITTYGDDDMLMEIMQDLISEMVGRPTKAPSPSQSGQSTTGAKPKVVSLSAGTTRFLSEEEAAALREDESLIEGEASSG